jgi:hypothetical protein
MSRIPVITERQIAPAAPYNPQQVVVPDMNAVPKALSNLGESITKTGGALYEMQDRKDKFDYSLAYSKFLQKSIAFQNDIDQSPDFVNSPKNYKEGMAKIKQETLGEIGSNRYAPNLKERMNLWEEQKYGNILKTTVIKQQDFALAETDKITESNLEAISRTKSPEDKYLLMANTVQAFRNALPDSDPNKEYKVQAFTTKIEKKATELDLMQRPYSEQISMLKEENAKEGSNITKLLSPDERIKWLKTAENARKQEIEDARIKAEKAEKQSKIKTQDELYNQVVIQGKSINEVDPKIIYKSSEESLKKVEEIRKRQQGLGQVDTTQDEKNYDKYKQMYIEEPQKFADLDINKVAANIPVNKVSEMTNYLTQARNGIYAPASLKQQEEIKNNTLRSIDINPEKGGTAFKTRFDQEVAAFKQDQKKDPSRKDLENIANSLVVQQTFEGALWGTNKMRMFEVDKDDLQDIVVPDDDFQEIRTEIKRATGREPSQDQIKQIYLKSLR